MQIKISVRNPFKLNADLTWLLPLLTGLLPVTRDGSPICFSLNDGLTLLGPRSRYILSPTTNLSEECSIRSFWTGKSSSKIGTELPVADRSSFLLQHYIHHEPWPQSAHLAGRLLGLWPCRVSPPAVFGDQRPSEVETASAAAGGPGPKLQLV